VTHEIPHVSKHTKPTGTFVSIRARDDLDPSSEDIAVQHSGRAVTAVPENVGLCQVIDVGPDVTNVRPGDICFIDFYDVAQAYMLAGEEIYMTQAMALRMTLDIVTEDVILPNGKPHLHQKTGKPMQRVVECDITPLPGYVLTKHAPRRMTIAVTGNDRVELPRSMTTTGIIGGRNSDGDPCTFVVYEEVVKFSPGDIQAERYIEDWHGVMRDTYYTERRLKARIEKLEQENASLRALLNDPGQLLAFEPPPQWEIDVGDLAVFCTEFSLKFRAIGEQFRCVPYKNVLGTVDDAAILADFYRSNPPAPLVRLFGT
jgi:hypothetical protein